MIFSIPWSARPDLNPVERSWDHLGGKVHEHKLLPKNKKELIAALKEEWLKIDEKVLKNLVDSMPRRVNTVIESRENYNVLIIDLKSS